MTIGVLVKLAAENGILIIIAVVFILQSKKFQDAFLKKIDTIVDKLDRNSRQIKMNDKMNDKQFLKVFNHLDIIDNKLDNNISGMKISLNAVILEELNTLQGGLFEIIDHNHFKENINHLNSKIDNQVNKFKTDLHSKVYQMTQDKRIVDLIDKNINLNEDIKKIFIEEIEKQETNYDFLKNKVENHLKKVRTTLIDVIYKYYESEK
ncbi:Uncharacterised protein [Sebaldella termitidis]|uniref:Uncharacterized protein n=1 Tax=Sebaldella termitidis (strain ATCC 33386 / NCTC 11300) TaxID=526218 RepID=D1AN54_SEBTE|nr:hypothetical protein [Sebaldella termitidis]ACZ09658.1 hypothetical protein Sterm_2814 [Sebaldella termitidis ATCC 33386]SUI24990.1 Uncharacterised protein [Sebaldella termitidis]